MMIRLLTTNGRKQALLFHRPDGLRTDSEFNLLTVDDKGFLLQIRLPNLLGMPLRKADAIAKLLSFAGDIACLHKSCQSLTLVHFICFYPLSQLTVGLFTLMTCP